MSSKIDIREAVTGDEVYQAGEWTPIAWVKLHEHSDSVTIKWSSGGTHSAPAHHFMARRLNAEELRIRDALSNIARDLGGAELPGLTDEQLKDEEDAQIEFERTQREQMITDVRDIYGEPAAQLVRDGWTVDSALAHVEGSCDRELCSGEHGRNHFIVDIDCEGDALQDRHELARLLRLVADRIEVGVRERESLQDINGNHVGSHGYEMVEG